MKEKEIDEFLKKSDLEISKLEEQIELAEQEFAQQENDLEYLEDNIWSSVASIPENRKRLKEEQEKINRLRRERHQLRKKVSEVSGGLNSKGLSSCPFCGNHLEDAILLRSAEYSPSITRYFVMCDFCEAYGPISSTREESIQKWNRRKTPNYDG